MKSDSSSSVSVAPGSRKKADQNKSTNQFLPKTRMYLENEFEEKMQREQKINQLSVTIQSLQKKLNVLTVQNEHLTEQVNALNQRLVEKDKDNDEIRQKYYDLLHQMDLLKIDKNLDSSYLIQLQHLRHDNSQLVSMLKSTKEFQDWATRADDSIGTLNYLSQIESSISQLRNVHYCACNPKAVIEHDRWVPQPVFKFAINLIAKNNWTLNPQLLDQLLYIVSKTYNDREVSLISHLRKINLLQVEKLKRKVNIEKVQPDNLKRLKNDINKLVKENVSLCFKQRIPADQEKILKVVARANSEINRKDRVIREAIRLGKPQRKSTLWNQFVAQPRK